MVSPKITKTVTIHPIIDSIIDNINAKESMLFTKLNQTDNKARQTHPQYNETHAKADMINTKPSTTHPNYYEKYSKPNERGKN